MKKVLILVLVSNVAVCLLTLLIFNNIVEKRQVEVVQHDRTFYDEEDRFIYSYIIELRNFTKNDYGWLTPELSIDIGNVKDVKLKNLIDLKAGSAVTTAANFSLKKKELSNEQINIIKEAKEKIVVDYILGQRILHNGK